MDIKLQQSVMLPIKDIASNKGQIPGVRTNPRIMLADDYDRLKRSIQEDPEMLSLRELLVYKAKRKYIVIGGNMRYQAMRELGYDEAPCKIIPHDTSIESLNNYILKDNGRFGSWDYDLLANEWEEAKLELNGIEIPAIEVPEDEEEDEEKDETEKIVIELGDDEDKDHVKDLLIDALADCNVKIR